MKHLVCCGNFNHAIEPVVMDVVNIDFAADAGVVTAEHDCLLKTRAGFAKSAGLIDQFGAGYGKKKKKKKKQKKKKKKKKIKKKKKRWVYYFLFIKKKTPPFFFFFFWRLFN